MNDARPSDFGGLLETGDLCVRLDASVPIAMSKGYTPGALCVIAEPRSFNGEGFPELLALAAHRAKMLRAAAPPGRDKHAA